MRQLKAVRQFLATTILLITAWAFLAVPAGADEQQWGNLKMQFLLPTGVQPLPPTSARRQPGGGVVDESLVVDPETRGVKDVVVYLHTRQPWFQEPSAVHPQLQNGAHRVKLALRGQRFEPRVVIVTAGDTLEVTNRDPVQHQFNFNAFKNPAVQFGLAPRAAERLKLEESEPAPVPIECNIHPWMKGYVVVSEYPYTAKSGESGILLIEKLPAGEPLFFGMFHERLGRLPPAVQRVERPPLPVTRNVFQHTLKPGTNDLGKILLPL